MHPNLSSNMHFAGEKLSRAHRSLLTACTHSLTFRKDSHVHLI